MAEGRFIWADLSTFRRPVTEAFYADLLGWRFDEGLASLRGASVAYLYDMPAKFQAMGLPSFWMSYISVPDIATALDFARANGGRVEMGPEPFEQGQIALIRDPLGAGFTVYAGPDLGAVASGPGARAAHGLFVSDASAVRGFYQGLFGWRFGPGFGGVQSILADGAPVAHLHEIPDPAERGPEEYWAVMFSVRDLQAATTRVVDLGGSIIAQTHLPEGPAIIARDPDGAMVFLLQERVP